MILLSWTKHLLFKNVTILYNINIVERGIKHHNPYSLHNVLKLFLLDGAVMVVIIWLLDLQLPMKSMSITTNVVSSNPTHGKVYLIQHYVIKFFSDLWQFSGFLHQLNWPPWYNWNIAESGIKHHNHNPYMTYLIYLSHIIRESVDDSTTRVSVKEPAIKMFTLLIIIYSLHQYEKDFFSQNFEIKVYFKGYTVKPVLRSHPWDKETEVIKDGWLLKRGSIEEKDDLLIQVTA